jgi:hypothetical protein
VDAATASVASGLDHNMLGFFLTFLSSSRTVHLNRPVSESEIETAEHAGRRTTVTTPEPHHSSSGASTRCPGRAMSSSEQAREKPVAANAVGVRGVGRGSLPREVRGGRIVGVALRKRGAASGVAPRF